MKTKTPNPKISLTFNVKWYPATKPPIDSRTVLVHRPRATDCFGFFCASVWEESGLVVWRQPNGLILTGVTPLGRSPARILHALT